MIPQIVLHLLLQIALHLVLQIVLLLNLHIALDSFQNVMKAVRTAFYFKLVTYFSAKRF